MDKQECINYIQEKMSISVKKYTILDLQALSDYCFDSYNDLVGHRVDKLIQILKQENKSTVE